MALMQSTYCLRYQNEEGEIRKMRNSRITNMIIGMAAIGAAATGTLSAIAALFSLISGEFVAAGVLLIAASLSCGMLSIAVFGR